MSSIYFERALFLLGDSNTGKSTQLRSMFLDKRLGSGGAIPSSRNLKNSYPLSNERWLYVRLTSPHEANETMDEFLKKCEDAMGPKVPEARRWNFAGALQVTASLNLAKGSDVVGEFAKRFKPERIRVAVISPDRQGSYLSTGTQQNIVQSLRAVGAEIVVSDATSRTANGLTYADFFDFT